MKKLIAWVIMLTLLMSLVPQVAIGVTAEEVPAAHSHSATQHDCAHCDETITWTAWEKTDSLPTDGGHYYLTGNVTVTKRTTLKGTVDQVLCLNGYTIDGSGKDILYYMQDSAKLTVDDCTAYTDAEKVLHAGTITNGWQTGSMPSAIYVKGTAELTVKNCYISNNTHTKNNNTAAGYGGAVQVRSESSKVVKAHFENVVFAGNVCGQDGGALNVRGSKATVTVKNCLFKENEAVNGGAVYVTGNTVEMIDCQFKNNTASMGPAVYVTSGTVNMTNCLVEENTATGNGGSAIRLHASGNAVLDGCTIQNNKSGSGGGSAVHTGGGKCNLTLKDCAITGNLHDDKNPDYRGAVYLTNTTEKLIVSGKTVIEGNYKLDAEGNQVETGIYTQNNPNPVDVGGLTAGAKISLYTRNYTPADADDIFAAATAPTAWNRTWLVYENNGMAVDYNETDKFFFAINTDHIHCPCGNTACAEGHANVEYLPWKNTTSLPTGGNYYLTADVALAGETSVTSDLNLCLNGKTVTAAAGKRHLSTVKDTDVTIAISDCTAAYDADGNYTAGKFTGGVDKSSNAAGGALYMRTASTLKLYDGILTGNTSINGGGAVFINEKATFEMYDGLLTDNTAVSADGKTWKAGGNIDSYKGHVKIYGGTIQNGSGLNGGGIYGNGGTITIFGGTICDNYSSRDGSGVYMKEDQLTVTGGDFCHSVTDGAGAAICFGSNSTGSVANVTVEENTAGAGAGLIVQNGAVATFTNVTVRNNKTDGNGGGIFLYKAELTMKDCTITGNEAKTGAGIYAANEAKLTIENGTISGNTATGQTNGVQISSDSKLTLKGKVTITGNGNSNLVLLGGTLMDVSAVTEGTDVRLTADLGPISTPCEDLTKYFRSESVYRGVEYRDGALYMATDGSHKHCYCFGSDVGCDHTVVEWAAWESTTSLPTSGNYYLLSDVVLTAEQSITDEVHICLNGHTVTAAENKRHISTVKGEPAYITISDCTAATTDGVYTAGKFVGGVDTSDNTGGGAIYIRGGGKLELFDGILTGNRSYIAGGALLFNDGATFIMHGGEVSGNKSLKGDNETWKPGGGIYAIYGSEVTICGGTIKNNEASSGGAIHYQGSDCKGSLTIAGGEISGNIGHTQTGGVNAKATTFVMTGGKIVNNTSDASAGGLYLSTASKATMTGGTIQGNTATIGGGIVLSGGSAMELSGGEITDNQARTSHGGGIALYSKSHLTMTGGTIRKNTAKVYGGGIYVYQSTMDLTGGEISGNTASTSGGGVAVYKAKANFNGGKITGNKAASSGGGLYMNNKETTAVIDGTEISKNSSKNGGGVIVVTLANLELKSGKVTGNTTTGGGAGIYISTNSKFKMTGGQVTGNTAKTTGGGVYCLRCTATFSGGSVSYNNAKDGAGINNTGATMYLYGTSITGNTATASGGGFKTGNTTATVSGVKTTFKPAVVLSGSYIANNKAKNGGGFILAGAGGTMKMQSGTVANNEATACGGGAYISTKASFKMTGGTFKNNNAKSGGAVYHLKSKGEYSGVEIFDNYAKSNAGAIYFTGLNLASGTFTNVSFHGNSSETALGGAIYANSDVVTTFTNCHFYENKAGNRGGAFYGADGANATMTNTVIENNEAVDRGGGVLFRDSAELTNCTIRGNKAQYGGGIYGGNPGEVYHCNGWGSKGDDIGMFITDCSIVDNDASIDGGGLHLDMTCYTTIYNSTFTGNTAGEKGSAMWLWENTTMEDVTVTGNVCGNNGHAVYLADSEFDGQTYINGLFKFGGDMIIKDNEGGDLFLDNKVTIGETNRAYGHKTHMNVTLDAGLLTQRVMGAYNYEGGNLVYTITCGDRSLTDPEFDPTMVPQKPDETQQTQQDTTDKQDIWLYVGVGALALVILAVVVLLLKKKKTKPETAKKD